MLASNFHDRRTLELAFRAVLYLGLGWGGLFLRRWNRGRREQGAVSWPTAEGTVLSGKVAKIPKTTRYSATLSYYYFVGEYLSGEHVQTFARETEADEFVRQMTGKRLMVRYKPSRPAVSLIESRTLEQMVLLSPRAS